MNATCKECAGAGGRLTPRDDEQAHEILLETDWQWDQCAECDGRGIIEVECESCGGAGVHHNKSK